MAESSIARCVAEVRQRIAAACDRAQRRVEDLRLIAVTKTRPARDLAHLQACGISDYGENRVDHLEQMVVAATKNSVFHYLGRVQSRQFPSIVQHCRVLHSLAKVDHLASLAKACRAQQRQMQIFVQVNPGIDPAKAGVTASQLPDFLSQAAAYSDCIQVIGLMTMAPDSRLDQYSQDDVRACFATLKNLAEQYHLPRTSMGMSNDYEIAIEEGATDLRIGSALFPARPQ